MPGSIKIGVVLMLVLSVLALAIPAGAILGGDSTEDLL